MKSNKLKALRGLRFGVNIRFNEFYGQYEVRDGDEWSFFCQPEEAEKLLKEGVDPDALPGVNVKHED